MYNMKRRRGYDRIVRLPHRQKWRPRGRYATKRRKLRLRPIAREEETDSDSESKVRRVQLFRLERTFKERPEEEREDKDKLADCKQCSSQAIPEIMSDVFCVVVCSSRIDGAKDSRSRNITRWQGDLVAFLNFNQVYLSV